MFSKAQSPPLTPYQKRLLILLSVASFFEGYDFFALSQILPNIGAEMGLDAEWKTRMVSAINAGTIVAFLLIRQADRLGRRLVLNMTILGYALCSLLSGFAPNPWVFTILQFLARIFLIGEWAIAMVYAAEEYPAERRGMAIGVIQAFSSVGGIVCAGVVPLLLDTPWGWRSVYWVGTLPLLLLAFARRNIRETARFEERAKELRGEHQSLWRIFRTPYRKRLLIIALIWALTYLCTQNAVTFWKQFVVSERGFSDADVGQAMPIAAVASVPLLFFVGRYIDRAGRRAGAVLIYVVTAVGILGAYSLHNKWMLTAALSVGILGTTAVLQVLNAFTTELFPTELRSDAFAWSNNILGRLGYTVSPLLVGYLAPMWGWGPAVRVTSVFLVFGLALIVMFLPETAGKELEETSRLD
ncbi:MAG: MFS transporter [Polyangiaceae bacterium]|nr:MFS transporter [Polyangiaceae bacterium]